MKSSEIPFRIYESIPDALIGTVQRHADRTFSRIRVDGKIVSHTYGETLTNAQKIAAYLAKNGFSPGERAAVLGENCPEWHFSHLGILWAGGIVVPLDARSTVLEWAHLMRHAECQFLFVSSGFYDAVREEKDAVPTLKKIIAFTGKKDKSHLPSIFTAVRGMQKPIPRTRSQMAEILYTSGTTGTAKGVMLTHGNILANIEQCLAAFQLNERDRFLSVLPIHHAFEGTVGFILPLVLGASVTFASSLKSKELLRDLKESRPTLFLAVPLLLEKFYQGLEKKLADAPAVHKGVFYGLLPLARAANPLLKGLPSAQLFRRLREGMGLGAVRYLVSGGAALPRFLSKQYEDLGFPILQGYGITETAPVLSVNLPAVCKNESVGRLLPGIEARIDQPDADGVGEIVVRGANIMQGYYRNEEATKEVLREGWFHTGDLGRIDKDGFLSITGRKKSVIVTKGGKNIHPEELEEELIKSPYVTEALVLAKIHPRTKVEEIHAMVYPDLEALDEYGRQHKLVINEQEIRIVVEGHIKRINKGLAEYKRIRSLSIREEEFPKTNTQKIKRYLFEEGGIEIAQDAKKRLEKIHPRETQ
jgi:long-chain acyl-CoA synthetase